MDSETLKAVLLSAPVLLLSLVAHEYAHAWAALSQGDPTARDAGRLTLNPIKHIDPVMTIFLPAMMLIQSHGQTALGGAKPCPVDPRRYRNYRRGDIIVSLAGVTMNFAIAIAATALVYVVGVIGHDFRGGAGLLGLLQTMLIYAVRLNLLLVCFNLLPLPPLDGSHVLKHFLPADLAVKYESFGRYGIIALMVLLWFGGPVLSWWLAPGFTIGDWLLRAVRPWVLPV